MDIPYFRGLIGQSEDQINEDQHTLTVTCHDYLAVLGRRYLTNTVSYATSTQDQVAADLLAHALSEQSSSGTSLAPGSFLPLAFSATNPDGTARSTDVTPTRVRTYAGQSVIGTLIDELAKVQGGYDYDVVPAWRYGGPNTTDWLRVFYPASGIVRTQPLEYGGAVASLTRSITSADYSNYWRILGNNGSSDPAAPQLYAEAWNADANNVTVTPAGLWMNAENAADVSQNLTLQQQANGDLAIHGTLIPTYTLALVGGTYNDGAFNMGDTVPLVVNSGRLGVFTTLRIMGISFVIGDDGNEDVTLTVGRPTVDLSDMLAISESDINALARR